MNPGGRQWRPNLIGYDALRTYGSPSYYAIQLFSRNHGDTILKSAMDGAPHLSSVTRDSKTGAIYIKYVNPQATPQEVRIDLKGIRPVAPTATVIQLAADPAATNTIEEPSKVMPVTRKVNGIGPSFTQTFPPYSITILRVDAR